MCLDARIYIFFEFIRPLLLVSVRNRYLVESESLSFASFRSKIAGFTGLLNNLLLDSKYKIYFECYRNF